MRILVIFGALTLLGCDDSITAVKSKTSTGLNSQRGAEKKRKKSHKNKGNLEPDLPVYTVPKKDPEQRVEQVVEKSSEEDKGPVTQDGQGEEKTHDGVEIKNGVDLAKARALHKYMKSLEFNGLKPEEISGCSKEGSLIDFGSGPLELKSNRNSGSFVSDESGNRYDADEITTIDEFMSYHLQEKLLELIKNGVLEIRRPTYLDEAKKFCEGKIVFEQEAYLFEDYGKSVPGVAARALEILKELHHLGIVHGKPGDSFVSLHKKKDSPWTQDDIDLLRLGDFSSAEFYINTDTGDLIPGKSPAVDLHAFAQTFLPESERDNFVKAISEGFDYDHWISQFKKMPNFPPQQHIE